MYCTRNWLELTYEFFKFITSKIQSFKLSKEFHGTRIKKRKRLKSIPYLIRTNNLLPKVADCRQMGGNLSGCTLLRRAMLSVKSSAGYMYWCEEVQRKIKKFIWDHFLLIRCYIRGSMPCQQRFSCVKHTKSESSKN